MINTKFIPLLKVDAGLPLMTENAARLLGLKLTGMDPGRRLGLAAKGGYPPMTATSRSLRQFSSSPLAASGNHDMLPVQSKRVAIKIVHPPADDANPNEYFTNLDNKINRNHPELAGAVPFGMHTTTLSASLEIEDGGFDFTRSGQNWDGHSEDGPRLYTTDSPHQAVRYGLHAIEQSAKEGQGAQASDDDMVRLLLLFMRPGNWESGADDKTHPDNTPGVVRHEIPDGSIERSISPSELAIPDKYVALALPPFRKSESGTIMEQLGKTMQKEDRSTTAFVLKSD
jgi:hypothetical protein